MPMDTRASFNLAKQRLDYYTCPIGIRTALNREPIDQLLLPTRFYNGKRVKIDLENLHFPCSMVP